MGDESTLTEDLLRRAQSGDRGALVALLNQYRARLKRMLRLDSRLQDRVDPVALPVRVNFSAERYGRAVRGTNPGSRRRAQ
jgi:hypothetical protein